MSEIKKEEEVKEEQVKEEVKEEVKETKPEVSIQDLEKLYKVIEKQNEKLEQLSKTKTDEGGKKTPISKQPPLEEKEQRVPSVQKTEEPKVEKHKDTIRGVYTG